MKDMENEPHILIVDDNPKNRQVLGEILTDEGYQVIIAQNGMQALKAAQAFPPDMILLDVMMPEMDGFETCEQLKADSRTHDIPVIFLTALGSMADKVKGFEKGGVDYVTKPIQIEELVMRVATHLQLNQLQSELKKANQELEQQKIQMEEELQTAAAVQHHLLPKKLPQHQRLDLGTHYQSTSETCGDWYGFMTSFKSHLYVLIGDVTGHGASAALVTATASSACHLLEEMYSEGVALDTAPPLPSTLMNYLNHAVFDTGNPTHFMTFLIARLNLETLELTFSNAGHCTPLLFRNKRMKHLLNLNPWLGAQRHQKFGDSSFALESGDILYFYTDGLTEAANLDNEMWGERRLVSYLKSCPDASPQALVSGSVQKMQTWRGARPLDDDISLVAVKVK